jgi:hypothetical protein
MTITGAIEDTIGKVAARAWTTAYDSERQPRDGAWVGKLTRLLDLSAWLWGYG